ncbi:MAG: hypothetical protein HC893_05910 [Chloroflexaceae bacterium]|nr:hypothetical protein [Chloroflexaceae bacterium]NJL33460.1 hypothetical protein [Chloroflexaceae bacterium]NJO07924.1 hypothetical protein [Chloroflexaceae bacterium]
MKTVLRILALLAGVAGVALLAYGAVLAPAVVQVRWTTASELATVGFHLYRSTSSTGPYTRITTRPIPASAEALSGGSYTYTDHMVQAGITYYYELEDIEQAGTTTRHGPIVVKARPDSTPWLVAGLVLLVVAVLAAGGQRSAERRAQKWGDG